MLVLQRKKGQSIVIGEDVKILISECGSEGVKLVIDAPREIKIFRSELLEAAALNKEAVLNKDNINDMAKILKDD